MSQFKLLVVFVISMMLLSACASPSRSSTEMDTSSGLSDQGSSQANPAFTLSKPMELAIGTLQLEKTDLAVDADQAKELVTLWQAYSSLSTSNTAAEVEVDAVLTQIEETMTPDQLQAIKDMGLSNADTGELFQSLGLELYFRPQGTPDPNFSGQGFRGRGGDFAPGTGPGEGGQAPGFGQRPGFGAGGTPDPSLMATRQAMAGGFTRSNRLSPAILQALIQYLEGMIPVPTQTPTT